MSSYSVQGGAGLEVGETVYTVLRHVSSSGLSRSIDLFVIRNNELRHIFAFMTDEQIEEFTNNFKRDSKGNGFLIRGIGMDMGFSMVYNLSKIIFGKSHKCIGQNCPSNDHVNSPDKEFTEHTNSGYALRQRWV